jgi:hypothetical protein
MDVDLPPRQDVLEALRNLKHDAKWNVLKPVIEPMFGVKKVKDIADEMKSKYGFDAKYVLC